ncbi:MAG: hypothetical protein K0R73_157 [Candidatus Midichloriaceae bacterium]|jgi:flagellar biosynthesis chaperone FliJ|nr:hypothetical protein [Candidatus Midichloriaceae bacterium]
MLKPKVIDKLIKINQESLDQKIKEKSDQEIVVAELQNNIDRIASEIESEKAAATQNPEITYAFQNYYLHAKRKLLELAAQLTLEQLRLDSIIEELKIIHVEISKYEHLKDKLKLEFLAAEAKREAKIIDEFNIINTIPQK